MSDYMTEFEKDRLRARERLAQEEARMIRSVALVFAALGTGFLLLAVFL